MSEHSAASSGSVTNPHLKPLEQGVNVVNEAIEVLFQKHSAYQLGWQPGVGRWGIIHIIAHLLQTGKVYHPRIEAALKSAPPLEQKTPLELRLSMTGRIFIQAAGAKSTFRVKTFKAFEPTPESVQEPEKLLQDMRQLQETLLRFIRQAEKINFNRFKIISPVSRFIRFNIGEVLWLLVSHQQRHLLQAQRVVRMAEFPGQ